MRFLILLALILLAGPASAQTATTTASTQMTFPACPAPNYYSSADGKTFTCTPFAGAAAATAYTAGPGICISPANVLTTCFPVTTLAAARAVTAADGAHTLSYMGAAAGSFALPDTTVANGWAVCFYVHGTGSITLTSAKAIYGGPTTLAVGGECVQMDDGGNWLVPDGILIAPTIFAK